MNNPTPALGTTQYSPKIPPTPAPTENNGVDTIPGRNKIRLLTGVSGSVPCTPGLQTAQAWHPVEKKIKSSVSTVNEVPAVPNLGPTDIKNAGSNPAFDAFKVKSSQELDRLIEYFQQEHPDVPISLITDIQDFQQNGLISQYQIRTNDWGETTEQLLPGALYSDAPAIILVDFRKMRGKLAELNELMDTPPRLHGKPLGKGCKIVALVHDAMKASEDFWSRISHSTNTWKVPETQRCVPPLNSVSLDWDGGGDRIIELDFQYVPEWRKVLLGCFALNKDGSVVYQPSGIDERVKGNTVGGTVVLKGAPCDDPAYKVAISDMMARGKYLANGETVDVGFLQFVHQPADPQLVKSLLQAVDYDTKKPADRFFCINSANIDACLSETAIIGSDARHHDLFAEILQYLRKHDGGLRVSSNLSCEQWVRLLKKIRDHNRDHNNASKLPLFLDTPLDQPPEFFGNAKEAIQHPASQVQIFQSHDEELLTREITRQITSLCPGSHGDDIFCLSLTPDLELADISSLLQVGSLNNRRFSKKSTAFVDALEAGKPILLRNLHQNPGMQQQLETLLQQPACLIIDGQRIEFPKARILVSKPAGKQWFSPVWQSVSCEEALVINRVSDLLVTQYWLTDADEIQVENLTELLLESLSTIPSSPRKLWPFPHPEDRFDVFAKVICQARQEQSATGSPATDSIKPESWRRAINLVLLDEYKSHTEVHAFAQCACLSLFPEETGSLGNKLTIDIAVLESFLDAHKKLDISTVCEHFWTLTRAFSPNCFKQRISFRYHEKSDPSHLAYLCRALIDASPEQRRGSLKQAFKGLESEGNQAEPQPLPTRRRYQSIERQLYEAFNSLRWHTDKANSMELDNTTPVITPPEVQICESAMTIGSILASGATNEGKHQDITTHLQEALKLPKPASEKLATGLTGARQDWEYWQGHRYQQLADLLEQQKMIFLKGEAGAGKTYTAVHVAKTLNPEIPPITITVGPQTSQAMLLQQSVSLPAAVSVPITRLEQAGVSKDELSLLRQHCSEGDAGLGINTIKLTLTPGLKETLKNKLSATAFNKVLEHFTDSRTETRDGPVMAWAKTKPSPAAAGRPITLVIDEANLADPDLWNIFQGMSARSPYICCGGATIPLTDQHRVIFTGNTETAPGRKTSVQLRNRVSTVYYPALPEGFLDNVVLTPRLEAINGLSPQQIKQCQGSIMMLWNQFKRLLPEHEFTPRDLHNICDCLVLFLAAEEQQTMGKAFSVTNETLAALVWLAMRETLGGEANPEQPRLESLELWFAQKQQMTPDTYPAIICQFDSFYQELKKDQHFYFDGQSQEALSRSLWITLKKCDREHALQKSLPGKHATLIEGSPGRGKDALLGKVLTTFINKNSREKTIGAVIHRNAGPGQWEEIKQAIKNAASNGSIIVISELNLLPSQFLEGELNDVITGDAKPGFHLFATVNPPEFSGREKLSAALQSRFVRQCVGDYSNTELQQIARRMLPGREALAQKLTRWHSDLRGRAKQLGSPALCPCTRNLISLLQHIATLSKVTDDQADELFNAQYKIYLHSAAVELSELMQASSPRGEKHISENRKSIIVSLYRRFPDVGPVTIVEGGTDHYQPETGILSLKNGALNTSTADELAKTAHHASLVISDGVWRTAGLPRKFPASHDVLSGALMVIWQREFATSAISPDTNDLSLINSLVESHYPLTEVEQSTLLRPENQPHINAVKRLLEKDRYRADPALFRRFLQCMSQPLTYLADAIQEAVRISAPILKVDIKDLPTVPKGYRELNQTKSDSFIPDAEQKRSFSSIESTDSDDGRPRKGLRHRESSLMSIVSAPIAEKQCLREPISISGQPFPKDVHAPASPLHNDSWKFLAGANREVETERVFQNFEHSQNRIQVIHPDLGDDGTLSQKSTPFGTAGYNDVPVDCDITELKTGQELGRQTLLLGDGQWHPLSGLTDYPQASVVAIQLTPAYKTEVVVDRGTGIHLIRLVKSHNRFVREGVSSSPENKEEISGINENDGLVNQHFTVDMVLKVFEVPPMFTGAKQWDVIRQPCPNGIKKIVGNYEDATYQQLRRQLSNAATPIKQVNLIEEFYLNKFNNEEQCYLTGKNDRDCLLEILENRPSSAMCGGLAIWMLASWCGIPSRIVQDMHGPVSAEVSADGGFTWKVIQLTSTVRNEDIPIEKDKIFPALPKVKTPNLLLLKITQKHTAEETAEILDTIKPGNPQYKELSKFAVYAIPQHISVSGPVSVQKTKDWLEQFCQQPEKRQIFLDKLMKNLTARIKDEGTDELHGIYQEMAVYIIHDRDWLVPGALTDAVHILHNSGQDCNTRLGAIYHSDFTHELIFDKDIRRPAPAEQTANQCPQEIIGLVHAFLPNPEFSTLLDIFYDDLPGTRYYDAPPGAINAELMIRRLPAFQRSSGTVRALRAVVVTAPMKQFLELIKHRVMQEIQDPEKKPVQPQPYLLIKSHTLSVFCTRVILSTFLSYLYKHGGGEQGSLKVLIPTQRAYNSSLNPLEKPYLPETPGWIKPESAEELFELADIGHDDLNEVDEELLKQSLLRNGFNDSNLCLLTPSIMEECLRSYLDDIKWPGLVTVMDKMIDWEGMIQKHNTVNQTKVEHTRNTLSGISNSLEAMGWLQTEIESYENIANSSLVTKEVQLIDDLICSREPD